MRLSKISSACGTHIFSRPGNPENATDNPELEAPPHPCLIRDETTTTTELGDNGNARWWLSSFSSSSLTMRRQRRRSWETKGTVVGGCALWLLFGYLCAVDIASATSSSTSTSSSKGWRIIRLEQHHHQPKKTLSSSYRWHATVDRGTGLATSRESSLLAVQTLLGRRWLRTNPKNAHAVLLNSVATDLFLEYPVWLCRGVNSFGLLRAVVPTTNDETRNGSTEIRTTRLFFNIPLLQLGAARRRKGLHGKNSPCTVVFPIVGGWLALRNAQSSNGSSRRAQNQGSLCFSLLLTNPSVSLGKNDRTGPQQREIRLTTSLQEYRPMLCGPAPIAPLRMNLYLITQSIVHSFVMWRFHRHCRRILLERDGIVFNNTIRKRTTK